MLEHPAALQVAGDNVTAFYRRWSPDGPGRPSVPWKLEAYSWGGLTEAPLASASWLLMAPFMMYNVAYFMLPPAAVPSGATAEVVAEPAPHLSRGTGHRIAGGLLRMLALAATVQFVSAVMAVTVSTVAWQAAGRAGMLPSWMGWYGAWTAGWRIALALAAVAVVVAALWWLSVTTASKYEARIAGTAPDLDPQLPLSQPGFWKGNALVRRQRALHSAAALAAALIAALPSDRPAAARWVVVSFAAAVLAAAAVSVVSPLAERYRVTMALDGNPQKKSADRWCLGVLAAAAAALIAAALVSGWTDHRHGPHAAAQRIPVRCHAGERAGRALADLRLRCRGRRTAGRGRRGGHPARPQVPRPLPPIRDEPVRPGFCSSRRLWRHDSGRSPPCPRR
jgi:hypothetical protein